MKEKLLKVFVLNELLQVVKRKSFAICFLPTVVMDISIQALRKLFKEKEMSLDTP